MTLGGPTLGFGILVDDVTIEDPLSSVHHRRVDDVLGEQPDLKLVAADDTHLQAADMVPAFSIPYLRSRTYNWVRDNPSCLAVLALFQSVWRSTLSIA